MAMDTRLSALRVQAQRLDVNARDTEDVLDQRDLLEVDGQQPVLGIAGSGNGAPVEVVSSVGSLAVMCRSLSLVRG